MSALDIIVILLAALAAAVVAYRLGLRDGRKAERLEIAAKPLDHLDWTTKP
jgi:hypothetical protein